MNVLIYVMTMLMLLSALTYARLESFRSFVGLEMGFNHYIESTERVPLDKMNEAMYTGVIVGAKSSGPRDSPSAASPRLSFYSLFKKENREKNQEAYAQTRELAIRLMTQLYAEQPFFKEQLIKRPNFLNEILDEIVQAADSHEDLPLKNAAVLSKLELATTELQYVLYLMLHGLPNLTPKDSSALENKSETVSIPDTGDEATEKAESEEASAPAGYASLIDYITVRATQKIRVFLAPPSVLMAIYGSQDAVDSIIKSRGDLYSQVQSQALSKEQATERFQTNFSQLGNASQFSAILDFSVTNTNPKRYH